jgi:Anti-sigma factor NepR
MRSHTKARLEPMKDEDGEARKGAARIDAKIRTHLGRKLKSAYQALVDEPVPDKFVELLDELRRKEGKS